MSQENIFASIKNLVSTASSIAQTRLEILSTDIQIARTRFLSLLVMLLFTLFFLFFGLVMLALLIVIYSWEGDRLFALTMMTGAFLLLGLILAILVLRAFQTMPKLFEASIAELAKDRQALGK